MPQLKTMIHGLTDIFIIIIIMFEWHDGPNRTVASLAVRLRMSL